MKWKKKLGESLIDRLVMVLLAGVLLAGVEYRFTALQKKIDARAAVSTVMTDALMQQRRSLMTAVEAYILLIDQMIENNKKSDPKLSRIERKIRLASGFFAAVSNNSEIKENARKLESNMVKLSNYVRGDRQIQRDETPITAQQRLQKEFIDCYIKFASDIRTVTLEAVELEYAHSNSPASSLGQKPGKRQTSDLK